MQDRLADEELDELVFEITRCVWSAMDCTACGRCCKELQPGVTEAEQQRLAGRRGLPVAEFRRRYLERDPEPDDGPAWRVRGSTCPFLQDNKCTVYEDRPSQCRGYPYLYEPDFSSRTWGMIERTFTCPVVYEVLEELKAALPFRRPRG
ncbi:MAG TPA: YkgJ family cysteine cluster protein [Phycisphaerae bacterium]|nr:YkgJ family cysteine cluster protein [Phycisphaerae bacterium]